MRRRGKAAPAPSSDRAALAFEQAAPRTYPFERDETHAGRMARIEGRQGQFKVLAHETNPRTGASWWALIGPWTPGDHGQFNHVREIKLVPERRAKEA